MGNEFVVFGDNEQHWHGAFGNIRECIYIIHVVTSVCSNLSADILQHALDEDCWKMHFLVCYFQCGIVHAHERTVDG